jgi:hypothetical protein
MLYGKGYNVRVKERKRKGEGGGQLVGWRLFKGEEKTQSQGNQDIAEGKLNVAHLLPSFIVRLINTIST